MSDPTQIRNQPSLTTSSGRVWLVTGGLMALIAIVVLSTLVTLRPSGLALGAIVTIVALYLVMISIRFGVQRPRLRLGLLAACMLVMAVIALACTIIVSAVEWGSI